MKNAQKHLRLFSFDFNNNSFFAKRIYNLLNGYLGLQAYKQVSAPEKFAHWVKTELDDDVRSLLPRKKKLKGTRLSVHLLSSCTDDVISELIDVS